jgi:hypothetical protein
MKNICRNCNHIKLLHFKDSFMDGCNSGWLLLRPCNCIKYEPTDNLEYLEQLANEK